MHDPIIDHDTWNYGKPRSPKAPPIKLDPIYGVLAFDGVRNPTSRSATSHKVLFPYRTAANDWQPKVGMAESAAEVAVASEALINTKRIYDLHFQPVTVHYLDEDKRARSYTHDLMITFWNGHRRVVFVRNETSLLKPRTAREIKAIAAATPKSVADDLIVVNASDYPRQRRENLFRMHHFVFHPDDEADEIVLSAAKRLTSLWYMKDLFPHAPITQARAFAACHRLIAQGHLHANLDHLLWENCRVTLAAQAGGAR